MNILTLLQKNEKQHLTFEGTPTVQQVLENAKIFTQHPCGGIGKCGKCAIEIIGNISQPDEAELLAGCRLSCRTKLYGDALVTLKNQTASASLIAEGFSENIAPIASPSKTITNDSALCSAKPSNTKPAALFPVQIGAAVDLGTTTIAFSVYDLIICIG